MQIANTPDFYSATTASSIFNRSALERGVIQPVERMSSGLRINGADDDAAGLAVATRLSTEARSLETGILNVGRTANALAIADGAMGQMATAFTRMQVLATAAASANLSDTERAMLNTEFQALKDEAGRIAINTTFAGKQILGDSNSPDIPFSEINLRIRPGSGGGALGMLSANGQTGGQGNFTEFVFEYRSTELVTAVSYDNARVIPPDIGAERGEVVSGITIPGAPVLPGDGFIQNDGDPLPDGPAGVLISVVGFDDLDIVFRDGTNGRTFEVALEFNYTPSSGNGPQSIRFTFGTATVGDLPDGSRIPLRLVEDLNADTDTDRDVSARIGSGIIPDQDDLIAVIPDVTLDSLNFALMTTDILTQGRASAAISVMSDTLDELIGARAEVGALMSKAEAAINNTRRLVELKTEAHAQILTANIAREVTDLANGRARLETATEAARQFSIVQRAYTSEVIEALDIFR